MTGNSFNDANTKIVATLSEALCSTPMLQALAQAGMRVARLNIAHLDEPTALRMINGVRQASSEIALLLDTKGPEIRTVPMEPLSVVTGQQVAVAGGTDLYASLHTFQVNYPQFVPDVALGAQILIDDGALELRVVRREESHLLCEVLNDGTIRGNKSVNLPGAHMGLPSLTEKDRKFLRMAAEKQLEFVAHSFVRNRQDVLDVREELDKWGGKSVRILAKIENQQGVENIEEILDEAYGILVARGDLGVEIPLEEVPIIQKHLIRTCVRRAKPVIVATQMLESMIHNPRPTRAEISDVANAVFDGVDAVMLSGETAYGKYPLEAVRTMSRIAQSVEAEQNSGPRRIQGGWAPLARHYIAKLAIQAATDLKAKAVIIPSRTGQTVLEASSYRQSKPIYAMCQTETLMRQLALSYGVRPLMVGACTSTDTIPCSLNILLDQGAVEKEDLVILVMSSFGAAQGEFNQLHINRVQNLLGSA